MIESELIEWIKKNPQAFSELFKLYYKPIFGYIFRRTGSFDHSVDIASDTFLKAFLNIKGFQYRGVPIKAWLYRIATNEVNLFYKADRRKDSVLKAFQFENATLFNQYLEQDRESLEAELQLNQQFVEVSNALKKLPLKYQEAIALRFFEDKSIKEISQILEWKEGTVKSILSRGLNKLKEKCNQKHGS